MTVITRAAERRHRARRGFTLIEVIIATLVASIGLLSAFYLTAQGTSMNADSKLVMAAHLAAQQKIEMVRNTAFASIASATFDPNGLGSGGTSLPGATGVVTVGGHPGDANGELKDVTVVVKWKDRGGANRSVAVATVIGKGGIDPQ
ncbi:MAG TPA: prepilin-type N-terminal cleavage/methylation domain-containing protein [Armatimonadota bacterium]|jgi:prepilin-type N-terminal cleavage/methylation domain-containing protein